MKSGEQNPHWVAVDGANVIIQCCAFGSRATTQAGTYEN